MPNDTVPAAGEAMPAAFDPLFIVESELQDLRYLARITEEISDLALNGATRACGDDTADMVAVEDELMGALRFLTRSMRRQIDEAEQRYVTARFGG